MSSTLTRSPELIKILAGIIIALLIVIASSLTHNVHLEHQLRYWHGDAIADRQCLTGITRHELVAPECYNHKPNA